jgi:hypothetical protein
MVWGEAEDARLRREAIAWLTSGRLTSHLGRLTCRRRSGPGATR